jgi:hypothetical protein
MNLNQKQSGKIRIGLWIDNLMDRTRVGGNLKQQRFECQNISDGNACFEFLKLNPQSLVILDLQNSSYNFDDLQKQFEGHKKLLKRVICFFPHVQIQLKKNAQDCGIEHVYPRSVFFEDTISLIKKLITESH